MQKNHKIAIISNNNHLAESLLFNGDVKGCETFAPDQDFNISEFALIIGDSSHINKDVKKAMKLFSIPIELQSVLQYIAEQLEQNETCRVSEQKRLLYIDQQTISLTEQETEMMVHMLKNGIMDLPQKALTDVHAFDAIKSIVYRFNNKLKEHGVQISLRITSKQILLRK